MGEMKGEKTARVPKGFAADHVGADLLKHKNYFLYASLKPDVITTPRLFGEIVSRFEAMAPLVEFLDAPLGRKGKTDGSEFEW
jgi:uncharacterized protein (DUF2461 family)